MGVHVCVFQRASQSSLQLQLAPSLEHQTAAMLSILERYKWHRFSVVTSQIAGHDDFIQAVREQVQDMQDRFKYVNYFYLVYINNCVNKKQCFYIQKCLRMLIYNIT